MVNASSMSMTAANAVVTRNASTAFVCAAKARVQTAFRAWKARVCAEM